MNTDSTNKEMIVASLLFYNKVADESLGYRSRNRFSEMNAKCTLRKTDIASLPPSSLSLSVSLTSPLTRASHYWRKRWLNADMYMDIKQNRLHVPVPKKKSS